MPPWEGRCLALNRAMGAIGAWTIDADARRHRGNCRRRSISRSSYYGKWALRLENMVDRARACRRRRDRRRSCAAARRTTQAHNSARPMCRTYADARLLRPAGTGARALQGRRARAHEKHPSADPHAPAALRARPRRRGRSDARLSRLPGHRPRSVRARTRNGFTPYCSTAANCGARTPIRRSKCRSRPSSRIWRRHEYRCVFACDTTSEQTAQRRGPVFREPWEAQAFALALTLQQRGVFSWSEWAATLGEEIKQGASRGRSRHRRNLLSALAGRAGTPDRRQRARRPADAGAHARSLAPRQRAHPARHADRAAAGRLRRLTSFDRRNHQAPRRTANGVGIDAVGDQEATLFAWRTFAWQIRLDEREFPA